MRAATDGHAGFPGIPSERVQGDESSHLGSNPPNRSKGKDQVKESKQEHKVLERNRPLLGWFESLRSNLRSLDTLRQKVEDRHHKIDKAARDTSLDRKQFARLALEEIDALEVQVDKMEEALDRARNCVQRARDRAHDVIREGF